MDPFLEMGMASNLHRSWRLLFHVSRTVTALQVLYSLLSPAPRAHRPGDNSGTPVSCAAAAGVSSVPPARFALPFPIADRGRRGRLAAPDRPRRPERRRGFP